MSAQQARERKKNYVQTLEERNQLQVRSNHPGSCMCKPLLCCCLQRKASKDATCVFAVVLKAEHIGI